MLWKLMCTGVLVSLSGMDVYQSERGMRGVVGTVYIYMK